MSRLLVVDDTPIIRSTIVDVVTKGGLGFSTIREACNGAEAIEQARREAPDVVLMDIRMPGVDGLEAAGVIRTEHPEARIVFLSAYDDFAYVQRALKLGAIDYLLKPIRPSALREILGGLVRAASAEPTEIKVAALGAAKGTRNDPIARALAYIRQNFQSSTISLAEVADTAHLSPSHLAHRFRRQVGVGYQQYVTKLRIDAAKVMLAEGGLPVAVIAEDVGYPNLTNFYRLFQRETGFTPAAWRRRGGERSAAPDA